MPMLGRRAGRPGDGRGTRSSTSRRAIVANTKRSSSLHAALFWGTARQTSVPCCRRFVCSRPGPCVASA